jgi:hypothetical protein
LAELEKRNAQLMREMERMKMEMSALGKRKHVLEDSVNTSLLPGSKTMHSPQIHTRTREKASEVLLDSAALTETNSNTQQPVRTRAAPTRKRNLQEPQDENCRQQ